MNKTVLLSILYITLLTGFILFFFSGPDYHSSRSYKTIWDQGHIFFYTIFILILLQHWKGLSSFNILMQYGLVIFLALITGIAIEFLQIQFSRIPEVGDIWRNILGCLVGLTFFSASIKKLPLKLVWLMKTLIIILVLFEFTVPAKAITDEIIAREQFPLLSGFETSFETDRWTADNGINRTQLRVYEGKYAASVLLTTEQYSKVYLKYFQRNWQQYQFLQFAVYNSSDKELFLICRINDREYYQNNQSFQDRYNKKYSLKPGWNLIKISLDEVASAPVGRKMNLNNIHDLIIFSSYLTNSTTIFIDDFKLVR